MNLCKSGIISARTKSLREKFSKNRSYSELSFSESPSSLLVTPTEPSSPSAPPRKTGHAPHAADLYGTESYCSALDLSVPAYEEARFPWQRDVAVQCDLLRVAPPDANRKKISSSSTSSAASTLINATLRMTGMASEGGGAGSGRFWKSSLLLPTLNVPLHEHSEAQQDTCLRRQKSHRWASTVKSPALRRAASFDSRRGYARLVQSTSSPSSPPECCLPPAQSDRGPVGKRSLLWHGASHSGPSPVRPTALLGASAAMTAAAPFSVTSALISSKASVGHDPSVPPAEARKSSSHDGKQSRRKQFEASRKQPSSAPDSFDDDSAGDWPNPTGHHHHSELYNFGTVHRLLDLSLSAADHSEPERAVKPFQLELPPANSCHPSLPSPNVQCEMQEVNPVLRKLSVLSRSPHRALAGRLSDSSERKKGLADLADDLFDDDEYETVSEEPPVEALQQRRRRRALVPPKLITDGYESATDYEHKHKASAASDCHSPSAPCPIAVPPNVTVEPAPESDAGSKGSTSPEVASKRSSSPSSGQLGVLKATRRRSSVVVIPPMQICPGDLLVYSKVLSQRSTMIDNLEGSLPASMLAEQEHGRKSHKSTWSLLRLFDRSTSRHKAAADQILCGLEEVLTSLQPSNSFVDESLLRYRSISWAEFLARIEERRISNASTSIGSHASSLLTSASMAAATAASASVGLGCSRFMQGARFSSLQSAESGGTRSACKKISLPSGGLTKTHLERLRAERAERDRPVLRRAESCSTVCDADSLADSGPEQRHEEGLSTDLYESDSFDPLGPSKRELRRRETLWELFQSDLLFLTEHLMVLKNVFMEPLKNIQVEGYAMFAEPEVLFGNLDELCVVTYKFCREFLNILVGQASSGHFQVIPALVKLFQESGRAPALTQAYHRYTLNYINALNYLETLRRQIEFTEFEKWCNRDTRCKKLQLTDLLVAPVQHVMRVPLLLKEIESRTTDPCERATIASIIEEQEHSLRELDDKMRWLKNFERLLEIQRNILWPSVLDMEPKVFVPEFLKSLLAKQPCERLVLSPRRQVVLEGPLAVLDSGKPVEMYVFLFDDLLLVTRRKKGLGKKQSTLTERWVSNCGGRTSSFSSIVGGGGSGSTPSASPLSTATSGPVSTAVTSAASATSAPGPATGGEPNFGPLPCGSSVFKYLVYKQPLSLDRFYIHDVLPSTEGAANLKNCFVLVCLNRFQQVTTLHTFQACSESAKNVWLSKLRDASARWKRTLQSNAFRNPQSGQQNAQSGGEKASLGSRLEKASLYRKQRSSPRPPEASESRASAGSTSVWSSVREASCSFPFEESLVTTSTVT